jgi:hypothetical protein
MMSPSPAAGTAKRYSTASTGRRVSASLTPRPTSHRLWRNRIVADGFGDVDERSGLTLQAWVPGVGRVQPQ